MSKSRIRAKSAHAVERAKQRLGIDLTRKDLLALSGKILRGEGVHMRTEKSGLEHWCVTHNGKALRAIFDRQKNRFVTMMERPGRYPTNRRIG